MDKKDLKTERQAKTRLIEMLSIDIAEIDKKIEAIENGPVSAKKWYEDKEKTEGVCTCCGSLMVGEIEIFKQGEQNDRKRTQPLIDAVKESLKTLDFLTDAPDSENTERIRKALKLLEENEV